MVGVEKVLSITTKVLIVGLCLLDGYITIREFKNREKRDIEAHQEQTAIIKDMADRVEAELNPQGAA